MSNEAIRKRLEDRRISVVAERTGISRGTLYRIMRGEGMTMGTAEKLWKYLNG